MQKRKLKRKYRVIFKKIRSLFFLVIIFAFIYLFLKQLFNKNYIIDISFNDDISINLKEDNIYCILSPTIPDINSDKWVLSNDSKCILNYEGKRTNLYLKKDDKIIYSTKKDVYFDLNTNDTLYLGINDKYDMFKIIVGNKNKINITSSNNSIVIDDDLNIVAKGIGKSIIKIKYKDYEKDINVVVSDLINSRNSYEFNNDKEMLSCNKYSLEEEKELENILKNKIDNAGYKTRAGVVEAARFLTLDFKYKINYFYENGRQTTNNVDGEGRYYHTGLYLTENDFDSLTGSTYTANKGPWGCSIYSYPISKRDINGLDCSGFVSWALLNGGFDVKDVGAGWSDKEDLTDFGEVIKLTKDISTSDRIKVGDLLHSERLGGHIAIIIGKAICGTHYRKFKTRYKKSGK